MRLHATFRRASIDQFQPVGVGAFHQADRSCIIQVMTLATAQAAWNTALALDGAFTEGIATRSRWRVSQPLHLVKRDGGGLSTWCTGAPALQGSERPDQTRCRVCVSLAVDQLKELAE